VERLPNLCRPHAQRTTRLQKALCELGLKIGGQAGADVGSELGISGSRDTILRLVRQSHPSAQSEPHVIGLDDWARKRRLRYGTLICDLELGLPIDPAKPTARSRRFPPGCSSIPPSGSSAAMGPGNMRQLFKKGLPKLRPRERPLAFGPRIWPHVSQCN
jgi:hypothetical protein